MLTDIENAEIEIWTDLAEFSMYQISNMGRLRNKKRPTKYLKLVSNKGYYKTNLHHEKIPDIPKQDATTVRIHRLVAETFLPNNDPDNKIVVDHINRNPFDNRACNLRWATLSENAVNSKIWASNTSGVKGVSWDKSRDRFSAIIQYNNQKHFFGFFKTIEEATLARAEGELKIFPPTFRPTAN